MCINIDIVPFWWAHKLHSTVVWFACTPLPYKTLYEWFASDFAFRILNDYSIPMAFYTCERANKRTRSTTELIRCFCCWTNNNVIYMERSNELHAKCPNEVNAFSYQGELLVWQIIASWSKWSAHKQTRKLAFNWCSMENPIEWRWFDIVSDRITNIIRANDSIHT